MSKKSREQRKRKRVVKAEEANKIKKENRVSSADLKLELGTKKARIEALNYLVLWQRENKTGNKEGWKFNKTRQVWLLKNWLSLEKVPAKHFKILVNYVATMQGAQKEVSPFGLYSN